MRLKLVVSLLVVFVDIGILRRWLVPYNAGKLLPGDYRIVALDNGAEDVPIHRDPRPWPANEEVGAARL
jgi:hypothetical protein